MVRRVSLSLFIGSVIIGAGILAGIVIQGGQRVRALAAPRATPSLTAASLVSASAGGPVTVPLDFKNGGNPIDTIFFVLSYDATVLFLDETDGDNDTIPDVLDFTLPVGFKALVTTTVENNEGQIQVFIFNQNSANDRVPAGRLLDATFEVALVPQLMVTELVFLSSPNPFFADKNDEVVPGDFVDGSVSIDQIPTITPIATATGTATTTTTPTQTLTSMPTVTGTPPTATPTPTATTTSVPSATTTATATPSPTTTLNATPAPHYLPALIFGPSPTPSATPTATTTPTVTASPTATPTSPVSPTATRSPATATIAPTASPTPPVEQCRDLVVNGGFENNSGWQLNNTVYPAGYVTFPVFSGQRALRAGIVHPPDNRYSYSSAQQIVFIPAGPATATLSFHLFAVTTGARAELTPPAIVPTSPLDRAQLADDAQMVLLFDSAGQQHVLLFQRQWYNQWRLHEYDLSAFRGQAVTLYFGVFNNGTGGVTGMYVDEVALKTCPP